MRLPFAAEDFMDASQQREFYQKISAGYPHLVKRYELPNYSSPNGYRSYRHLSEMAVMNEIDLEYRMQLIGEGAISTVAALVSASVWQQARYHFPLAYVGRDIAEAASETELPGWLDVAAMPWPLPAISFMLPQGMFISPLGNEASALSVARVDAGQVREFLDEKAKTIQQSFPQRLISSDTRIECGTYFVWATLATPAGAWKMWGMDSPLLGTLAHAATLHTKIGDYVVGNEDDEDRDNAWLYSKLVNLALNLLMIMNSRPELIEPQRKLKTIKKKSREAPTTLWEPRWIGRDYRYVRDADRGVVGTHASPRTHWRRGHYRDQAYGPKHTLRKTLWIEPIMVKAP